MKALRREQEKLGASDEADPSPSEKFDQFMRFQRYALLSERQKQIADLLLKNPDLKNVEIADELGISAARVGQVRKTLD